MGYRKKSKPNYEVISREGRVTVERRGNSVKLRWSYNGKVYDRAVALAASLDAVKAAKAKARQIDSDMILGQFDESLVKYFPRLAVKLEVIESTKNNDLTTHWENYKEIKRQSTELTTQKECWKQTDRCLRKVSPETLKLENAQAFFLELSSHYSAGTIERVLVDINAAINLAIEQDILVKNPYRKFKTLLPKSGKTSDRTRMAWTKEELKVIIKAFEDDTYKIPESPYKDSYYLPYVKFLAFTGCRPEEVIALTWDDFKETEKGRFISITKAYSKGVLKGTKTGKTRDIEINDELFHLIKSLPKIENELNLVFPGARFNRYITQKTFQSKYFLRIVTRLHLDGKISHVSPSNNLRHTRITALLADGVPPVTVAQLMGTSTEMIYSHYCGNTIGGYQMPPMMKTNEQND